MTIILHGATNGRNFGDFLFASMFYNELAKAGHDVYFYSFPKIGISNFYKKHIPYNKKCSLKTILNADVLVYFSGGYFGERTKTKKEAIVRYLTYFPIGELFRKKNKKIIIVGVGGAPISHKWLRDKIVKIINSASLTIFRDDKTTKYYKENGVKTKIETTVDTAISLSVTRKPARNNVEKLLTGKKNIFIHVPGNQKTDEAMLKIVAPAVKKFIDTNSEYNVIIGGDNANSNEVNQEIKNIMPNNRAIIAKYDDPWRLYDLLGNVDLIITPKLHVGIIGSALNRSVISFPYHPEKTKRFYEQIDETGRSISISEIDEEIVLKQIKKYYNKPIIINEKLVNLSRYNIEKMIEILNKIEKDEK